MILADGFFEWRHERKKAYPYYIGLNDRSPFAIAGIWDAWGNPETGETLRTCSVITTAANLLLEKVHNTRKRVPVILRREYERKWLEENLDVDQIHSMLLPYDANEMFAFTVPNIVNRLGFNTTDTKVLKQHTYPELPSIKI